MFLGPSFVLTTYTLIPFWRR